MSCVAVGATVVSIVTSAVAATTADATAIAAADATAHAATVAMPGGAASVAGVDAGNDVTEGKV